MDVGIDGLVRRLYVAHVIFIQLPNLDAPVVPAFNKSSLSAMQLELEHLMVFPVPLNSLVRRLRRLQIDKHEQGRWRAEIFEHMLATNGLVVSDNTWHRAQAEAEAARAGLASSSAGLAPLPLADNDGGSDAAIDDVNSNSRPNDIPNSEDVETLRLMVARLQLQNDMSKKEKRNCQGQVAHWKTKRLRKRARRS